ncbi:zinc finger protein 271 [Drosophila biarmipes]|uniref:zinc finger protein 271 n=1 Tax=Drosophila biarmipes TaxID=125945 RepID=UPI0007E8A174|nr:zinc finger protein 271 [Drosophila biarmipes]
MLSSRTAGDSKWVNQPLNNKEHVESGRKERSPKQVNKKLVDLLIADAEDDGAHSASNSTLMAAPTPDSAFFDGHSEEESNGDQEKDPPMERKCRTCFQVVSLDGDVKDLYDRDNIALIYHIEVTTGVWIETGEKGLPHHICATCQETLQKSVDFRDKCIQIDKKFKQAAKQNSEEEIESELENVLYEESLQQANKVPEIGFKYPELGSDSECVLDEKDISLDLDSSDFSSGEDGEERKRSSRKSKRACNEIVSIKKCETQEEIGKVDPGAEVYKVVLSECNWKDATKQKYSLPLPKPVRQRVSLEEKKRRRRERVRAKPFNYVCDKCGHSFRQPGQLQMHLLRHSSAKNFDCPECPKKFFDAYTRNIHLRARHKGEKPFPCNHCNKSFPNASSRHRHERKDHGAGSRILTRQKSKSDGPDRHICTQCTKSYSTKNALSLHMNSHNGARPFKCSVCQQAFTDPSAKRRHEANHDKFPFHCDICFKGFLLRSQLITHRDVHTADRPHWCEFCDVHYRHRYKLNIHYKSSLHKNNVLKAQEEECNGLQQTLKDFLSF